MNTVLAIVRKKAETVDVWFCFFKLIFTSFICCSQGAVGANMNSVYKKVVKILMGHLVKEIRTVKCQHFPCNLLNLIISPVEP